MENTEDALKEAIINNKPIKGMLLGLALEIIDKTRIGTSDKDFHDKMKEKFKSGEKLSDYEKHIFVDVLILHRKLSDLYEEERSTDTTPRQDN